MAMDLVMAMGLVTDLAMAMDLVTAMGLVTDLAMAMDLAMALELVFLLVRLPGTTYSWL
jgi:hypothetical protein